MEKSLVLAEIFTDNMVLQRDSGIKIWGSARTGSEIMVEFCGQRQKTRAWGEKWSVTLLPVAAGGPYILRVADETDEVVLKTYSLVKFG
ncbi:hypothetical protein [Paenibacillus beijingensis]|uniref:hypothetical protein n=1 Tax=Paenibacillus beijingensis TaxID=1126833 RepID=UPI000A7B6FE9|nr:hypothetical protein [Paenibacillus beijingensis]